MFVCAGDSDSETGFTFTHEFIPSNPFRFTKTQLDAWKKQTLEEKQKTIIKMITSVLTVHDDKTRKGASLKLFGFREILRRLFRKYKCEHLTHGLHKEAYELMLMVARKRCCGTLDDDGECPAENMQVVALLPP